MEFIAQSIDTRTAAGEQVRVSDLVPGDIIRGTANRAAEVVSVFPADVEGEHFVAARLAGMFSNNDAVVASDKVVTRYMPAWEAELLEAHYLERGVAA